MRAARACLVLHGRVPFQGSFLFAVGLGRASVADMQQGGSQISVVWPIRDRAQIWGHSKALPEWSLSASSSPLLHMHGELKHLNGDGTIAVISPLQTVNQNNVPHDYRVIAGQGTKRKKRGKGGAKSAGISRALPLASPLSRSLSFALLPGSDSMHDAAAAPKPIVAGEHSRTQAQGK
jgi:hypothetical protein